MEQTGPKTFTQNGVSYEVRSQNRLTLVAPGDAQAQHPTQVVALLVRITLQDGRKGVQAILGFGYENEEEAASFSRLLDEGKRLEQSQALAYFSGEELKPYIYDVLEVFA